METFFDLIAQRAEFRTKISEAIIQGHLHHCILTTSGSGGPAIAGAMAVAQTLLCIEPNHKPCGKCTGCNKAQKMIHPDLHFLFPTYKPSDAASKSSGDSMLPLLRSFIAKNPYGAIDDWTQFGNASGAVPAITAPEARRLMSDFSLKAYEGGNRVCIVLWPELMNQQAANALLKSLEEPPEKAFFVLASNRPQAILATILSRSMPIALKQFDETEISDYLIHHLNIEPELATQFAFSANGSMAEAIKLAEEQTDSFWEFYTAWLRTCYAFKTNEIVLHTEKFAEWPRSKQANFLHYTHLMLAQAFRVKFIGVDNLRTQPDKKNFAVNFGKLFTQTNIEPIINSVEKAITHIEGNIFAKAVFFDLSYRIHRLIRNPE